MHIRPFQPDDLVPAADLFCRIFRAHGKPNRDAVAAELEHVYFANPWYEQDRSSLVSESDGRLTGFLGVMRLPMRFKGRELQGAIGGNFMVEPGQTNPYTGSLLMKRFVEGPYDLAMTDTSNESGRKVWTSIGGTTSQLYSLQWVRLLRPVGFGVEIATSSKKLKRFQGVTSSLGRALDATLAKVRCNPFRPTQSDFEVRELTSELLLEGIKSLSKLQPLVADYKSESLAWLLEAAARKKEFGNRLIGKALFRGDAIRGWYLYYPNAGRRGQVVQVLAQPRYVRQVLEHLFGDAWNEGSTSLVGRVHPLLMDDLPGLKCFFLNRKTWVQFSTRDEEVKNAIHRGEALFTRLEGEWWTRFQNDDFEEQCQWSPANHGGIQVAQLQSEMS